MSNRWLTVTNLANRKAELSLRGVIGLPKMWEQYGANAAGTAKDLEKELKNLGEVDEITLRVYSPGGFVFDALAMHDILANHPARIIGQVDGLAASAATIVLMAADEIVIPANAYMMIHNAQGIEAGDHRALAKMAADLEKWSGDIAKMYAGKIKATKGNATKKTLTEMRGMMDAETWLTGTEAHALGLANKVTNEVALSNAVSPLDFALRLPINLDRVPEAVRAAFDTAAPTSPPAQTQDDPAMLKIHTPLFSAATDTPPAGGAPVVQPTAQAPAPGAQVPVVVPQVIPPQPTAQAPAGFSLDDVRNAVAEAVKPLGERITSLEGLRAAGVSPTAWGNQPPVGNPANTADGFKNEADVRAALGKAKNFAEKREIMNQARKAGINI